MKAIYLAIVMLSIVFTVFGEPSDQEKLELIKQHKTAVHIKDGWIRDPYNIGLGNESVVGNTVRVWRSADLVNWEYLGEPYAIEHN